MRIRPSCLCLLAALAIAGEGPFNGSVELGENGRACPGFYLRQWFLSSALPAGALPAYLPVTADDGAGGHCLRVPGVAARWEVDVNSERFRLERDGEVEFSFRYRCAPADDGSWTPDQPVMADLRAWNPDVLQWKPAAERYPVLFGFTVKASREWQTQSKRVTVRGGFPYSLMFRCAAKPKAPLNALEIDDISVRYVDAAGASPGDEAVVVTDREFPSYGRDDTATLAVRARLSGDSGAVTATLVDDHGGATVATRELTLVAAKDPADRHGRRLWTGTWPVKAPRFGSFSTVLTRGGAKVRLTGGDLVVARTPVRHPAGTPGATLGINNGHIFPQQGQPPSWTVGTKTARPGDEIPLMQQAGLQAVRIWGDQGMVAVGQKERPADDVLGREIDAVTAGNMSVLFILGGTFGSNVPKPEDWEAYVSTCLRLYGKQVHWWEVVNEASNGWKPDQYMPVLTAAHRLVKAAQPKDLVIGNGATGDVGPRPLDWTKALVERGHERFLDAIAFHPYKAELDVLGQDRFKYRDLVASLRGLLREQRPLWNTECYYLKSATRKQGVSGEEQGIYAAGDLLRHYFDGLWHGVAMTTGPMPDSFTKLHRSVPANRIPNEVFAGVNAFSCLLEGMTKLERVEVNPLVRSGVFISADGKRGLGMIYDLRAGGSRWVIPEGVRKGVELLDLFGNLLPVAGELRCSIDPVFLRGEPAAITALFKASRWQVAEPVQLHGRMIGGLMHLEAVNRTGQAGALRLAFPGSKLPEVDCVFSGTERFTVSLPAMQLPAKLAWTASDNGEQVAAGTLDTASRETALALDRPLRVTLPKGTVLTVTARAEHLAIAAEVTGTTLRAAPGNELYEGSALEAFIDADPGFWPDCDAMALGTERMPVTQYVAAALPSATGKSLSSRAHRNPAAASAARSESTRSATGWTVRLEIPWSDIAAPGGMSSAIGLDAEIDHYDAAGKLTKEAWGPKPGESHHLRAHYAVLTLPPEVVAAQRQPERAVAMYGAAPLADGSFEGSGAWQVEGGNPALRIADGVGFGGTRGADITVTAEAGAGLPKRVSVYQKLPCRPRSGKVAEVRFLLRLTDLKALQERLPSGYRCGFSAYLHFYDGAAKQHMNNEGIGLFQAVLGSQEWTLMTFRTLIPDNATELTLSLGTQGQVSGRIQIDDVAIRYVDP